MANDKDWNDTLDDAAVIAAFKDKTKEMFHELGAMDPDTIEAFVKDHVQKVISDYNLDVKVEDVVVSGSRSRGLENEGSDLDVVVYFSGSEREDDFFNILHEEGIIMGGIALDINPISQEKSGSLSEYLKTVEAYLAEKSAQNIIESEHSNVVEFPKPPETIVTYTVAECSEFHSLGVYHENIETIDEAKKLYEKAREDNPSMIPALGINVHAVGTSEYDDVQWDFLSGNRIDLNDLGFLPDIWNNPTAMEKLETLVDAFPNAEIIGTIPGREMTEPIIDTDPEKPVYIDEAAKIAAEIDRFSLDFDAGEYNDTVSNWEAQVQNIADDIRKGNSMEYKVYLGNILDQSDNVEDVRKAAELLIKLAEYKPLAKVEEMEEENLNQIDNVLSNTVPKAEERKISRNAEQELIEEEERKKRSKDRPSLRARLEEKKAIVAANSADRQNEKQRKVQTKLTASQFEL